MRWTESTPAGSVLTAVRGSISSRGFIVGATGPGGGVSSPATAPGGLPVQEPADHHFTGRERGGLQGVQRDDREIVGVHRTVAIVDEGEAALERQLIEQRLFGGDEGTAQDERDQERLERRIRTGGVRHGRAAGTQARLGGDSPRRFRMRHIGFIDRNRRGL